MNTSSSILFDHSDFVVINKPVGIAMHDREQGIVPHTQQFIKDSKLYLVHRLDTPTSGCLLLAKTAKAAAYLSNLFARQEIQKFYIALIDKKPKKKQGTISGDMTNRRKGQHILLKSQNNPAVTQFFSQSIAPSLRACMIKPLTGKTHQIRVALKSLGSPILGDIHYGGTESDRTYLHAFKLYFTYFDEQIVVEARPNFGIQFNQAPFSDWLTHNENPLQLNWPNYLLPDK